MTEERRKEIHAEIALKKYLKATLTPELISAVFKYEKTNNKVIETTVFFRDSLRFNVSLNSDEKRVFEDNRTYAEISLAIKKWIIENKDSILSTNVVGGVSTTYKEKNEWEIRLFNYNEETIYFANDTTEIQGLVTLYNWINLIEVIMEETENKKKDEV